MITLLIIQIYDTNEQPVFKKKKNKKHDDNI